MCCLLCGKPFYAYQAIIICEGPLCDRKIHKTCLNKFSEDSIKKSNIIINKKNNEDDNDMSIVCKQCYELSNSDSLSDLTNIINKENKYRFIYETFKLVKELTNEVKQLRAENISMKNEISHLTSHMNKTEVSAPSRTKVSRPESRAVRRDLIRPPAPADGSVPAGQSSTLSPGSALVVNSSPGTSGASSLLPSSEPDEGDVRGGEWMEVKRRKRRSGPPPLQGCRQISSLSVAKPKKAFFVSRLDPETNEKDIEDYIRKEFNINYVSCTKLVSKFNYYASFHVSVTSDDFVKLNHEDAWPRGVLAKPFFGKLINNPNFNKNSNKSDPIVNTQSGSKNSQTS